MRMIDFWKKLFLYSQKKYQKEWRDKNRIDLKCPHCGVWLSLSSMDIPISMEKLLRYDDRMDYTRMICCQCEETSYWRHHGPIMTPVTIDGKPLT